jgi:esterase/lipase superfamily enzyme
MIIVSCRKHFDSDTSLSRCLQIRDVPAPTHPEDSDRLFIDDLQARARNRHICILIHGYSNPLPDVLDAYVDLQTRMEAAHIAGPNGYGLIVGFTWPGLRGAAYPLARQKANRSARHLLRLINHLRSVAFTIDIQTHSLGARVALGALRDPSQVFIDNLLLTAAAVDSTVFQPGREFRHALKACSRCFVYYSRHDAVLRKFYPVGDAIDGIAPALGLNGPRRPKTTLKQHPNLTLINCAACIPDHSAYRQATPYYAHWQHVLSGEPLPRYDSI